MLRGARLRCEIRAQGDPGYKATAVMLGEICQEAGIPDGVVNVLNPETLTPSSYAVVTGTYHLLGGADARLRGRSLW